MASGPAAAGKDAPCGSATAIRRIGQVNEMLAVGLTRAFGTMWICYAFMIYGLLPAFTILHPYEPGFLYWSNWIQLWSLPLILVGTNILGRDSEQRARIDHEKLALSYDEQRKTYSQILKMFAHQEKLMAGMAKQDEALEAQDVVLAEQTDILKNAAAGSKPRGTAAKP
jgi:hypothetical protein